MTHTVPATPLNLVPATPARRRALSQAGRDEQYAELLRIRSLCGIGSWHLDSDTGLLTVSDEMLELCGLDRDSLSDGGRALLAVVVEDDRARVQAAMEHLVATGDPVAIRFRAVRPDASQPIWLSARGEGERDETGRLVRVTCAVTDISELAQAEGELLAAHAELLQAHNYQQAVIATTPDAIHVYDVATGRLERANRSGKPLIGYEPEAVAVMMGEQLDSLVPAEDRAELASGMVRACLLHDGEVVQLRHRVRRADGSWCWLSRRISVFERDAGAAPTALVVVTRDITDVVAIEQRLEHAATHDELTGLPNRRHAHEQLEAMPGDVAVLAVDLDGFKQINDFYGHASGDAVLRAAAHRLRAATRSGDLVARLGGDEFLVLIRAADVETVLSDATQLALRVEALFGEPFLVGGQECSVTASIGISVAGAGSVPGAVLAQADAAMYQVKRRGGSGHAVFDTALADQARRDDHIERNLRRAVRDAAIDVHYQPIVDPRSGAVEAVEALVRIRDETGAMLDAGLVVSVAERCGLVSSIDDLVLLRACEQVAAWRGDSRYATLQLAVNRSARDILRPGFSERVLDVLRETALPPGALTIEVTESVLLDAQDRSIADVRRLADCGVRLAIDDFGTGYASLSQLTALPVSSIKIDRSFTSKMLTDPTCRALVRASIGLAADLGLACVVEGVETGGQLASLPRYTRMRIQGYLYGRPRPAEDGLDIARLVH